MKRIAAILMLASMSWQPAFAESPMTTDDAGTLDRGEMKLEAVWRDGSGISGGELLFGVAPSDALEVEIGLADLREGGADARVVGLGLKWVPVQREQGWSTGLRIDYAQSKVTPAGGGPRTTEDLWQARGLATHRFPNRHALHLNLGLAWDGGTVLQDTRWTWGAGYELPIRERLDLTAETFGIEGSGIDWAIGLRRELTRGLRLYGSAGHGESGDRFKLGLVWQF